jgi:hypothetical protein
MHGVPILRKRAVITWRPTRSARSGKAALDALDALDRSAEAARPTALLPIEIPLVVR